MWATDLGIAAVFVAISLVVPSLEPGTAPARAAGVALLGFWMVAAFRAGRVIAARLDDEPAGDGARLLARGFLHSFFFVLVVVFLLAAVRALRLVPVTIVEAAAFVVAGRMRPPAVARPTLGGLLAAARRSPPEAIVLTAAAVVASLNCAWGLLSPVAYTDDMSYHLVFPVEWMQSGTLSLKDVPFGNHSPTYHPKNVEAVYAWALLPLRELFPLCAFSFLWGAAGVLALHDLFRRLGAGGRAAAAAASLFVLSPVVSRQSACGCVDVPFSVFLILSVNAMLAFRERQTLGRWIELCVAVGAFLGTKILGLPLTIVFVVPVFVVVMATRGRGGDAGAAGARVRPGRVAIGLVLGVAVTLAAGGWWYVRNWMMTGNPVFPVIVEAFGRTVFDGAYLGESFPDSEAITILDLATRPVQWLLVAGALFTVVAAVVRVGKRKAPGAGAAASVAAPLAAAFVGIVLPAGLALILKNIIPLDEERFVLAAYGFALAALLVPLERARGSWGGFAWLLPVAIAATLLWRPERASVVLAQEPRLLSHSPFVDRVWVLVTLVFLAAAAIAVVKLPRGAAWTAAVCVSLLGFAALTVAARISDPVGPYATTLASERWAGSSFLDHRGHGLRIAATGEPGTLQLYGRQLDNVVRYVNVNDTPGDLFHDHVLRWPERRALLREDRKGIGYFRYQASYDAWLHNLDAFGADLLVTSKMPRHALNAGFERDRNGFPQETIWADAHPERFREVFGDPAIRIYEVVRGASESEANRVPGR